MNISVGNLPYSLTESELRDAFAQFGNVSSVNILTDRETGRPRGFGFVEMPNQAEATAAVANLNSMWRSSQMPNPNLNTGGKVVDGAADGQRTGATRMDPLSFREYDMHHLGTLRCRWEGPSTPSLTLNLQPISHCSKALTSALRAGDIIRCLAKAFARSDLR